MRRLLALLAFWAVTESSEANGPELLKHLRFHSTNFENILIWERGKNSTPETVFSVAYSIYGTKRWQEKGGCQNMTSQSCNLTGETGNICEYYYARVTALTESGLSASFKTHRFNPKTETELKPPDVTFDPGVDSIRFILGPSLTLARDPSGSPLALEDIFPNLLYHLRININQTHHMIKEGKEKEYVFPGLAPDTEYSGTVGILIPNLAKHSPTHKFSVRTLPDRTWTYYFSGMSLFTMGFLVAVACFVTYKYINKHMQQPRVLDLQKVLTYHPLKFTREHVLTPVCDLAPPATPAPPGPHPDLKEASKTPQGLPSCPETTYVERDSDHAGLAPLRKSPSPQPYTRRPSLPLTPPPPFYGVCVVGVECDGQGSPLPQKHTRDEPGLRLQVRAPAAGWFPKSIQERRMAVPGGDRQHRDDPRIFPLDLDLRVQALGLRRDWQEVSLPLLHPPWTPAGGGGLELEARGYLQRQNLAPASLLSSVQVDGDPEAEEPGPERWHLLSSLVGPQSDLGPGGPPGGEGIPGSGPGPGEAGALDWLFRDLDLTVQWDS
ncbi:interleukin-22 receptor subunit alpha-1 isoform X2 [Tachyglossus aculeatus]|uniref:interleukin-22 receptor subunit alpha-1 isoform X2 n=1 Tax=Tachyglossus aculeatus TaxID=9261 RepID=UPI0018F59DA1|nr:interleukin-22 receptor subunit alpha-1 isoform X2 [Tachyglossus aculeatus]